MSTPAIIILDDKNYDLALYKHFDGYPEATLAWLKKFNSEFTRQDDSQYKFAQLVRSSAFLAEEFYLDVSDQTGWGIVDKKIDRFGDYLYTLNVDGTVTVSDFGDLIEE